MIWKRQTEGSVLCTSCGNLVGVNDGQCFHCGRRNPGMWGYGGILRALGRDMGFVKLLFTGSIALYIATLLIDFKNVGMGGFLDMLSPSGSAVFLFGASGQTPVFEYGRWWTLLSAGWLHGSILHILFNMMIARRFAPAVAEFYGAGRMIIIYTVSCVTGFFFSSVTSQLLPRIPFAWLLGYVGLGGAQLTLGASASIFGLLGALLYYGHRTGSRVVQQQMISYAVMFAIFGILVPRVDNQAHLGGFVGGYLVARFLDPLLPERGDHLAIAVGCIVATALAIIVSVITGLQYL